VRIQHLNILNIIYKIKLSEYEHLNIPDVMLTCLNE